MQAYDQNNKKKVKDDEKQLLYDDISFIDSQNSIYQKFMYVQFFCEIICNP